MDSPGSNSDPSAPLRKDSPATSTQMTAGSAFSPSTYTTQSSTSSSSKQIPEPKVQINRIFDLSRLYEPSVNVDDIVAHYDTYYTYVPKPKGEAKGQLEVHPADRNKIIIAVAGESRRTGGRYSRASWAVYYSPKSANSANIIPEDSRKHNDRLADMIACHKALEAAIRIFNRGYIGRQNNCGNLKMVVIKMDSNYVYDIMTGIIVKWEQAGWVAENMLDVPLELRRLQEDVAALNRKGVEVFFWLVPREKNSEAHALAIDALENGLRPA